eukprot:965407-Prymnesium_polylepis.1
MSAAVRGEVTWCKVHKCQQLEFEWHRCTAAVRGEVTWCKVHNASSVSSSATAAQELCELAVQ